MVSIVEVRTGRQKKDFLDFPLELYKNNEFFVPPLYMDEKKMFGDRCVYNDTCDSVFFNAYRDGKMVGRIQGIIQRASNEIRYEKRARFNRFDSIDDQEVADALLDAGCGTGAILKMISDKFPGHRLAGLDMTPKMVEHAVAKKIPGAEFTVGDCERMPYPDSSFDVVVNSMSVHHYPDPQAFFREVARVLRPGGRLILRDVTMRLGALRWFVNHVEMPLLNRMGYGDVKMYSLEEMRTYCGEAGLEVETLECRWPIRLHLVAVRRCGTRRKLNQTDD